MVMDKNYALVSGVLARKSLGRFASWVMPEIEVTDFHMAYYDVLNAFAHGRIKKLIVSVPPQHGKSLGSSQLLPAFMLGVNPDLNICIASYAFSLATKFNKRVQRIIKDGQYRVIFPDTKLKDTATTKDASGYVQTSEEFEIVGRKGSLRAVGREGSLTGNRVDVMILDDLYKDAAEANSPLIRENAWEWYLSVVKTRLHNDSQELIVFTRWHEDDLIGRISAKERVVRLNSLDDVVTDDCWYYLNFEAIKDSEATELDSRDMGVALWEGRHGIKLLNEKRDLDRRQFDCMYQGQPASKEGLLYGDGFKTYSVLPVTVKKANYTDTADMGEDCLCSICYEVGGDGLIYVVDVLYTNEPMEVTEGAVAGMISRNATRVAYVESNNGGRGFARAVQKLVPVCRVDWFHQSGNKESRILTNSATVLNFVVMPEDWRLRFKEFYGTVTTYKRLFRSNKHDDAADALTGIIEKEVLKTQATAKFYFPR